MAKPEKRWSAFSIELRGANSWSARNCVCDAWRSVRAEFGSGEVIKVWASHRTFLLFFSASFETATNCSLLLGAHKEDYFYKWKLLLNSELWLQTILTGRRCRDTKAFNNRGSELSWITTTNIEIWGGKPWTYLSDVQEEVTTTTLRLIALGIRKTCFVKIRHNCNRSVLKLD